MTTFVEYLVGIAPGFSLVVVAIAMIPARHIGIRVVVAIMGFLFVRDAMTTSGLWEFGATANGAAWLRFGAEPIAYWLLAAMSAATIVLLLWGFGAQARRRLVWQGEHLGRSLLLGVLGAVVVVTPFALLRRGTPNEQRGGAVALSALPALLAMALVGNALEELLFRGYLYDALVSDGGVETARRAELRAALATGVLFAAGHLHLAMIVTDVGLPLIVFVLVEGLVCGLVRLRAGIVGSTLTHGLAIFVLASGLL
ncbi:CPBP family intramembrane glutamic endopeptidase [Pseudactinotalea sp.]|uniref:CPBP family intramembrane glutamic endopeptidase n=1 Tax=Pseudactinotalea sp. TaxID=1926260 RepID=UPI003B3A52EE